MCGATSLSSSHVILACDGAAQTFGPFPSGPSSRTYTCTRTTIGGLGYLQVSGLAYSTTIVDGAPPTLNLPSDITAVVTGPFGTQVRFSVSASDSLDPSPTVTCSANSGAVFPIGTTTVKCTARDAAGNTATGSFHVSVVYKFGGFLPPLESGAAYHIGSVIPVNFTLTDAGGRDVPYATAKVTAGSVTGASKFERGQYVFFLDTRGMPAGPLTISASLNDGTAYSVVVDLTTSFPTSLSLNCDPSMLFVGGSAQCEATVTSQGGPSPTGAVAFASSDSHGSFGRVSCRAGDQGGQVDGGRPLSCSVEYSPSSPGEPVITATYPGDAQGDLSSSATFGLTVTTIPTTTSLSCDPSAVQPGRTTRCVADVGSKDGSSPTGTVAFSSTDAKGSFGSLSCSLTDRGSVLACTAVYSPSASGAQTVTAVYSGDASHASSKGTFVLNGRGGDSFPVSALGPMGLGVLLSYSRLWQPAPTDRLASQSGRGLSSWSRRRPAWRSFLPSP